MGRLMPSSYVAILDLMMAGEFRLEVGARLGGLCV